MKITTVVRPVLLKRPDTVANILATDSRVFIWKLSFHWLRGSWQHPVNVTLAAHAPGSTISDPALEKWHDAEHIYWRCHLHDVSWEATLLKTKTKKIEAWQHQCYIKCASARQSGPPSQSTLGGYHYYRQRNCNKLYTGEPSILWDGSSPEFVLIYSDWGAYISASRLSWSN